MSDKDQVTDPAADQAADQEPEQTEFSPEEEWEMLSKQRFGEAGDEEEPEDPDPDEEDPDPEGGEDSSDPEDSEDEDPQDTEDKEEPQESQGDLEERLRKLQHQLAAAQGRVAPTQRENQQLKKRIAELESKQSQPRRDSDKTEPPANSEDKPDLEKWERYEQDFPDDADAVKAYVASLVKPKDAEIQRLQNEVADLRKSATETLEEVKQTAEQRERLETMERERQLLKQPVSEGGFGHSDFDDIAKDKEFHQWARESGGIITELYQDITAESYDLLLTKWKQYQGFRPSPQDEPEGEPETPPVVKRRQKQLTDSKPTSAPPVSRPDQGGASELDPETQWDLMAKERQRRESGVGR